MQKKTTTKKKSALAPELPPKQFTPEELLRERKRYLQQKRSEEGSATFLERDTVKDSGEISERSHEEWLFLNLNRNETQEVKEIDAALERVNAGTYGICE